MLAREMASEETTRDDARQAAHQHVRLFAVRLWNEALDGGCDTAGACGEIATDAFRSFRDWSDLVAFMVARLEHEDVALDGRAEGGG